MTLILLSSLSFPAHAISPEQVKSYVKTKVSDTSNTCLRVLRQYLTGKTIRDVSYSDRSLDYLDDFTFLNEEVESNKRGSVLSFYDEEHRTRIYHNVLGNARPDGTVPVVDPNSPYLFVYFHGSGTAKARGSSGSYTMNRLGQYGHSAIAMDLPWHGDGPTWKLRPFSGMTGSETERTIEWIHDVISTYKAPDQKLILFGHSFGPEIALEYAKRYPMEVYAVEGFSPGGRYSKEVKKWQKEHTAKFLKYAFKPNEEGGAWAGAYIEGTTWNKPISKENLDPTKVNPNLKILIRSGEEEEYFPGPISEDGKPIGARDFNVCEYIKQFFANLDCVLWPNVGHLIFDYKKPDGSNAMFSDLVGMVGQSVADEKAIKTAVNKGISGSPLNNGAVKYATDSFFKQFVDLQYGPEKISTLFKESNSKEMNIILTNYKIVQKNREERIKRNIIATENWAPEFYNQPENKDVIDAMKDPVTAKKAIDKFNAVRRRYLDYLEGISPEKRAQNASADSSVYEIPKKAARDDTKDIPSSFLDVGGAPSP